MQIILNADDFGHSDGINAAVRQAHREGVLTSASLMVAGEAMEQAVSLARQMPTLEVGLHVVVVGGRATLPPERIPHIVDGDGRFGAGPFAAGLRYFSSRAAREELARELEAQFDRFAATGLPLGHVNGHQHMHLHPTVFRLLLPLACKYGARGFRLPRDDLRLALDYSRRQGARKALWALTFGILSQRYLGRLGGLAVTHQVYGLMQSGQMEEAYVLEVLRRFQARSAELYFHPSLEPEGAGLGPNPGDLETLLSPALRDIIQERGLRLATYATLKGE